MSQGTLSRSSQNTCRTGPLDHLRCRLGSSSRTGGWILSLRFGKAEPLSPTQNGFRRSHNISSRLVSFRLWLCCQVLGETFLDGWRRRYGRRFRCSSICLWKCLSGDPLQSGLGKTRGMSKGYRECKTRHGGASKGNLALFLVPQAVQFAQLGQLLQSLDGQPKNNP